MVTIVKAIYRITDELQSLLKKHFFFHEFCDIINHISRLQILCDTREKYKGINSRSTVAAHLWHGKKRNSVTYLSRSHFHKATSFGLMMENIDKPDFQDMQSS